MKLVSFSYDGTDKLALLVDDKIHPIFELNPSLPTTMLELLEAGQMAMDDVALLNERIIKNPTNYTGYLSHKLDILAPIPNPPSLRDGYAFRQHVATARRNRGLPMIPQFDEYPVFYFGNHKTIVGGGKVTFMADHFQKLDFELECAIVIGKKGKNIHAKHADDYIAGYTIMNDWSARTLQLEEMLLNLGPAKGKDFATGLGTYLLTPDELQAYRVDPPEGHVGCAFNLPMKAYLNGKQVSEGNLAQMDWTFAELIERASYGATLYPGDVIGSGTVGTGCFLELNGSALLEDPNYQPVWIQDGDEVTLEIEALGTLTNKVHQSSNDYSLLALKKGVIANAS